ncbi:GCN5 family acetyltransferase [Elizabethkingia meningoseptica]|uniref:GNAT family N-acetyltransferase n=1 Tax=Elizabethkingia meningoseptica TaxID=238 RepID=A0A1T3IN92_ELIME|nr:MULTISPECIES: GNAT family N-acetyltransferase [Elizabethkingia]AQX12917.1 GCN5 family acetyltransferase [Elizabethkingia meningoseptica]MBG0514445.1 GNAT family N-acetyltransferase [Elizabethkingia meningoseptica]MDE5433360.1 GNAT family N-acetyltransferase [Elizabethkingia meningoseptica]MDE5471275.1 GNAT family N-acetyltransferase [Elizabethkingia meningoseptica]MDE5481961.1 GNAT family N-acetyltransferase [Elizabethkingia meningoseptica]
MNQETIHIHHHAYTLVTGYQDNEVLRTEFNRLTDQVWGFDFENFYKSGFWKEDCIIYSLFDNGRIVSHATVSLFDMPMGGKVEKLLQLGTVMTAPEYEKKGLSRFLMERIMADFRTQVYAMFLFANASVLDFYPKFGFTAVPEYQAVKEIKSQDIQPRVSKRKLNLDKAEDLHLFEELIGKAVPNAAFTVKSKGISMFYCYAYPDFGYKDSVFYIDELECAVVVERDGDILDITEVFSEKEVDLHQIMAAFTNKSFSSVRLGFSPKQEGFKNEVFVDEDLMLFVSEELESVFKNGQLMVPVLSHT